MPGAEPDTAERCRAIPARPAPRRQPGTAGMPPDQRTRGASSPGIKFSASSASSASLPALSLSSARWLPVSNQRMQKPLRRVIV